MQDLDADLRHALKDVLSGSAVTRRACLKKVFSSEGVFSHIAFFADNLDDVWGVYQLWAWNNVRIDIDIWQIVANPEGTEVMVNSIEHCWLWWNIPFALLGGPKVFLHTVFQLEDTAEGKKITKQVDHTMWVESLLFHNLPPIVDDFFQHFWRPTTGRLWSITGNWVYEILNHSHASSERVDIGERIGKHSMHPERFREDLARAIHLGLCGSYRERRELAITMYTDDAEFWHPFAHVQGAANVAGFFQTWCTLNRKIDVSIFGFIPSTSGNEVMVDMEQQLTPFFWPPFFPPLKLWLHVILYLKDSPAGGKLIYKHEDHALWIESLVFGNPLGRWYKDNVRPLNGVVMGSLGRIIWMLINWWCDDQPEGEYQAQIRSGRRSRITSATALGQVHDVRLPILQASISSAWHTVWPISACAMLCIVLNISAD